MQSLEILQNQRGQLCKIVVDLHPSHINLETNELSKDGSVQCVSQTLLNILKKGESNILSSRGISVILADGVRHSKVGLAESTVWSVKQCLIQLFPTKQNCSDLFEFNHRLSIIQTFLNEHPIFSIGREICTPHIFNVASLKCAGNLDPPQLLSTLIFPSNAEIKQSLNILSTESKRILTSLASDLSQQILN